MSQVPPLPQLQPPTLPPSTRTYVLIRNTLLEQSVNVIYISKSFNDVIIKLHDELKKYVNTEEYDYEHYTKVHNDNRKIEIYKRSPGVVYGKSKELMYIYEICEYII